MSQESLTWLNRNVLVGNTDKRGKAWHYAASAQGDEPNHYPGPIPIPDIYRRLFYWEARPVRLALAHQDLVGLDDDGNPVYVTRYDEDPVSGFRAIQRSDTGHVFHLPTDGYVVHQYGDVLIRQIDALSDDGLLAENAGLLRNGGRAFVQAALPASLEVAGMELRPTILAASSHDGTLSLTFKLVFGVVLCDNTLSMALVEPTPTVRFKHTRGSTDRVATIADGLGLVETAAAKARRNLDRLAAIKVTDDQFRAITAALLKPGPGKNSQTIAERQQAELWAMWDTDERVAPIKGTAFGAVQAFNTWRHHVQTVRGVDARAERNFLAAIGNGGLRSDRETVAAVLDVTGAKLTSVPV